MVSTLDQEQVKLSDEDLQRISAAVKAAVGLELNPEIVAYYLNVMLRTFDNSDVADAAARHLNTKKFDGGA